MAKKKIIYPKEFLKYVQLITNKRARIVINHILKHGFITTEDLEKTYGYDHPPRAARDVREIGIPLETYKIKSKNGKSIAAYKFGDLETLQTNRVAGRIFFSKTFKHTLYKASGGFCQICNGKFEERYLQVDHRVPYEIGGDLSNRELGHFMLLCGSCNRIKSWSCEHCENWITSGKQTVCIKCYWGNPKEYKHIAMKQIRRIDLQWKGDETRHYDKMKIIARKNNLKPHEFIKKIIKNRTKLKLNDGNSNANY